MIEKAKEIARLYDLDPAVVCAVCEKESNWSPDAFRFEEHYPPRLNRILGAGKKLSGFTPGPIPTLQSEIIARSCSWGLMQIMGETARWCAKITADNLPSYLLCPCNNINTGCKVLKYYLNLSKGNYREALTRYNAGSPSSLIGQKYADDVLKRAKKYNG